jgi:hypothetical protein
MKLVFERIDGAAEGRRKLLGSPVTHPDWVAITRIPRPLPAPRR